jgi:hypothetical protein
VELLVRTDLAALLGLAPHEVQLVGAEARTWPDSSLGCAARKGVLEPAATPGFEMILRAAGNTHIYHTDLDGSFIRCSETQKPLGPISGSAR